MISFKCVQINSIDSYEKLGKRTEQNANEEYIVEPELIDAHAIDRIKRYLGNCCDEIKVEYPYYDRDYLSTYYIHYAKKLRSYKKVCCRLHIFFKDEYYGYITLRPTMKGTKLGKTFLKPEILIKDTAYLMLHDFKTHIVGNEMEISSFPWKSQETDIAVCAHTATWTVISYFGSKFRDYPDATIGELVDHTDNDWGRKTPSLGLNPVQVSDLLKNYNFNPLILQRNTENMNIFFDDIIAYIESGIPIVGFLHTPLKHAVSLIGHGQVRKEILDDVANINLLKDDEINGISHSRLIDDIYVMDDNCFPYRKISRLPTRESDTIYGWNEFEYAVVPLYRRMQLTYSEVYERFRTWRKQKVMNWEEICIYRIYITSANSLKEKALDSKTMNSQLKDVILNMTLPRFVWCIDLSGVDNFKEGLTSGRIIIDTTASTMDAEPWLIRHDGERIDFVDVENNDNASAGKYSVIQTPIEPYCIYENNLKKVEPIS